MPSSSAQVVSSPPSYDAGTSPSLTQTAAGELRVAAESTKATYSAGFFTLTPAATPQDVFTITGSASKTVRVRRIVLTGTATTAGTMPVGLVKHSAVNTGGTSSTLTRIPHDSTDPAATAVVSTYTANPTAGAAVGTLGQTRIFFNLNTAAPQPLIFDFSRPNSKPVVLRGTSEVLSVSFAGAAVPAGGTLDGWIEWTEE